MYGRAYELIVKTRNSRGCVAVAFCPSAEQKEKWVIIYLFAS